MSHPAGTEQCAQGTMELIDQLEPVKRGVYGVRVATSGYGATCGLSIHLSWARSIPFHSLHSTSFIEILSTTIRPGIHSHPIPSIPFHSPQDPYPAQLRASCHILGMCLGHQSVGAAFGGRLSGTRADARQNQRRQPPRRRCVRGLAGLFTVNRYHSLAIKRLLPGLPEGHSLDR